MRAYSLLLFLALMACKTEPSKKSVTEKQAVQKQESEQKTYQTPDVLLGELFKEVQLQEIFTDSKTFVDCTAKIPYDSITAKYESLKNSPSFDLKDFVLRHFEVPTSISSDFKSDPNKSAEAHVASLWPVLQRESDTKIEGSTLIALPKPYIVPGGRFREVYYWDSYFTMLGLVESGKFDAIEAMLDNFAFLIQSVGHIPNGNRTYYITRSQPPFFSQMVKLLANHHGDQVYEKYKDALRKEYTFWMEGSTGITESKKHCVQTKVGVMNRYFDSGTIPRQESYKEDFKQVQKLNGGQKMYRDLRSGAESGWDYSSRWFADKTTIETIVTTDIIPVDLNALLFGLEEILVGVYADDTAFTDKLKTSMANRKRFLNEYCVHPTDGTFEDYNFVTEKRTGVKSLAMVYPLFFGIANQKQADDVAIYIEKNLLKPGGVVTSLQYTGEQWDAPNGWAPLQWMTIVGLENYGHSKLAKRIARRWVLLNERVYENTGKFVEKYNVEDMSLLAGGGEYPVQDGFGWSNGVYLALKTYLKDADH